METPFWPKESHDLAIEVNKTTGSQLRAKMSSDSSEILQSLAGNRTGTEDPGEQGKVLVFKVLSITAASLVLILLILLLTICSVCYQKHHRRYRRACEYENTVRGAALSITAVKRVLNIHKFLVLVRKRDSSRLHSQVYIIYNNPAMATEEEEEETPDQRPPINQTITDNMKSSGIILNPCVFYG